MFFPAMVSSAHAFRRLLRYSVSYGLPPAPSFLYLSHFAILAIKMVCQVQEGNGGMARTVPLRPRKYLAGMEAGEFFEIVNS
jgi:hypothetical protein